MSLVESTANIVVGFAVAFAAQIIVFPMFRLHVDLLTNIRIGIIFTAVSLVRSYVLRRLFEWIRVQG